MKNYVVRLRNYEGFIVDGEIYEAPNEQIEIDEFYGTMKITPKYAKCDPLFVKGHWVKKDIGKPFMVWCDEGLYKNGVNVEFCEIFETM